MDEVMTAPEDTGQEPNWKTAFTAAMKQRNEWMNRAQNLEIDLALLEDKLKETQEELVSVKDALAVLKEGASEVPERKAKSKPAAPLN